MQSAVPKKRRRPAHARVRAAHSRARYLRTRVRPASCALSGPPAHVLGRTPSRTTGQVIVVVLALALLVAGTWPSHSLVASGGGGSMPIPAGYTSQQMIFDDRFSGTSLDTTKWNTYLGAQGMIWNDHGRLPSPFSGPNTPRLSSEAGNVQPVSGQRERQADADGTSATPTSTTAPIPWISGAITTEGKFSLPTSGWYVQAKIKLPGMTQGMWPGTLVPAQQVGDTVQRDRLRPGRLHRRGRRREPVPPRHGLLPQRTVEPGE